MKHARPDYARIQDPAGLIPEGEPVFLLRGQDLAGHVAVRAWANAARNLGASREIVQVAIDHAFKMQGWASKVPDLPVDGATTEIPLVPPDDAKRAEYLEGRMQHWLDEAQRLAGLVRTLGGNPEPGAAQPAFTAMQERTDICQALGCVDEPGVPLKHVLDLIDRKAKAYAREIAVLQGRADATPLERVRHLKSGGEYEVLGEAEAQVSTDCWGPSDNRRTYEGDSITVYRGTDGKLWARFPDEFRDGRFETIAAPDSRQSETIAAELEEIAGKASEEAMAESSTDRGLALLKRARTYRKLAEVMRQPGFGTREA